MSETFQVAAIIGKLPLDWKNFKNYLKHKRKKTKIEDLIIRLHIEEDNNGTERKVRNPYVAKANVIEHGRRGSLKSSQVSSLANGSSWDL